MDRVSEVWESTQEILQGYPIWGAAIIVVVFAVLARLADRFLSGTARRLTARSKTDFDDRLVDLLHRPIFNTVALVGLLLATYSLDLNDALERFTLTTVQTILALVWMIFGLRASKLLLSAMRKQEQRFGFVQTATEPLLANTVAVILFVAGAYSLLLIWGINVTGLLASAGIVGLALSFAAQDTLANLFAGVAILADRPYEVGDFIILDGLERGQVTHIGLRSTRLLTREDIEVSIPNGLMGNSKIVNEAGGPPRQVRIAVSVGAAYGSDIDHVIEVLLAVGSSHEKTLSLPEPQVRFREFGDSSLNFDLLCWIKDPAVRGLVLHELNCEVYRQFAKTGIQIPSRSKTSISRRCQAPPTQAIPASRPTHRPRKPSRLLYGG
jgi:MscS family membrane protein